MTSMDGTNVALNYHKRLYVNKNLLNSSNKLLQDGETKTSLNSTKEENEILSSDETCGGNDKISDHDVEEDCDVIKRNIEEIVCELDKEIENEKKSENDQKAEGTKEMAPKADDIPEADHVTDQDHVMTGLANQSPKIKLETLKNTNVAMAQVVENNMAGPDVVPSLMQTIYSLWHQQMMQCHMLEVVRQHLSKIARDKKIHLPSLPQVGLHPSYTKSYDDELENEAEDLEDQMLHPLSPVSPGCPSSDVEDIADDIGLRQSSAGVKRLVLASLGRADDAEDMRMLMKGVQQHIDTTSPSAGAEAPRIEKENRPDQGTATDRKFPPTHKCHVCNRTLSSSSELEEHVRSHNGEPLFHCDICPAKFLNREDHKVHYEKHIYGEHHLNPTGINNHKISNRDQVRSQPHSISNLINSASPVLSSPPAYPHSYQHKQPMMPSAKPQFPSLNRSSPVTSFPLSSTRPPFSGPFTSPPLGMVPTSMSGCGMPPFYRPSILPQEDDDDDQMEQFMEIDKSETTKLEAMVKNMETKLTDPNQCAICKRILSCKSALQMHYRTHTGERPFKCKICGRAFTTKGNLKTHMGVHKMKPLMRPMHQCPICQKQFTNPFVLQQHIQNHNETSLMFPRNLFPPSLFPFGNMSMLPPHIASKFPPFMSPDYGHNKKKYDDDNLDETNEDAELDVRSETGVLSESSDNILKRPRFDDDEIDESKRHKGFCDDIDSSDDEEVPKEKSDAFKDTENRLVSKEGLEASFKQQFSPTLNSKFQFSDKQPLFIQPHTSSPLKDDGNPFASSSLNALEERVKALEQAGKDAVRATSLAQDMKNQFEEARNEEFSELKHKFNNRSETTMSGTPNETDKEFDRGRPNSISPESVTPLLKPYNLMDLQHPLNFNAGRPGLATTCDVCYKTFACKSALEIHYRSHTKEKPFHCKLCDRGFSTKGNLKQHLLTHKIRDLQDAGIDTSDSQDASNDSESKKDMIHYQSNGIIQEPHSPKTSPDKPEGGYQPESEQRRTEADHSMPSPYHVSSNASINEMSRPVNTVQPLQRVDESYMNSNTLRHICQVCQKPFSSSSALQIHMRTHTGERPFKCEVCGKAFTTKGNLKVHMSTHEDRNSFNRHGHRMALDHHGMPHFEGFPNPMSGFPSPGLPPKPGPDFFLPRFPFMAGFPGSSGFFPHRNGEFPMIRGNGSGLPGHLGMMSPNKPDQPKREDVGRSVDGPSMHSDQIRNPPRSISHCHS